jgi:hypothetical protein
MSRTWTMLEKLIALLFIAHGVLWIYTETCLILQWIEMMQHDYNATWNRDFIWKLIERANFHYLIRFFPVVGGVLLLWGKRSAWMILLSVGLLWILEYWFLYSFELYYPAPASDEWHKGALYTQMLLLGMSIILTLSLIMPPILKKYTTDKSIWWGVLITIVILLIDFYFTRLKGRVFDFLPFNF